MDIKKGFRVSFVDDQNNDQIGVVIQKWVKKAKIKTDAGEIFYIPIDELQLEPIKKIDKPDQLENDQVSTIVENFDDQIPFDDLHLDQDNADQDNDDQDNDHPYIDNTGIIYPEIYLNPNNPRDQYYDQIENLELTIDQSLSKIATSFYAIGKALHTIKENKLYSGYDSFVDYCFQRWEFRSAYAYNLIAGFLICENLVQAGFTKLPRNESQCRVLASLSDEDQIKVWGIISQQEIITANVIKSEVQKIKKILAGSEPLQVNLFNFQDDQDQDNEDQLISISIPRLTPAELSNYKIGLDYLAFKSIQLFKIIQESFLEIEVLTITRSDYYHNRFDPVVIIQTIYGDIKISMDDLANLFISNEAERRCSELGIDKKYGGDLVDFLEDHGFLLGPETDDLWWDKKKDQHFRIDQITYTLEDAGNSAWLLSANSLRMGLIYYKNAYLNQKPDFWLSTEYPQIKGDTPYQIIKSIHDLDHSIDYDDDDDDDDETDHYPNELVTEANLVIDEDDQNYQPNCTISIDIDDKDTTTICLNITSNHTFSELIKVLSAFQDNTQLIWDVHKFIKKKVHSIIKKNK